MDFVSNIWSKTGLKKEDSTGDSDQQTQQSIDSTADQVTSDANESSAAAAAESDGTSVTMPLCTSCFPLFFFFLFFVPRV